MPSPEDSASPRGSVTLSNRHNLQSQQRRSDVDEIVEYVSYRQRWVVMLCVVLVTVANNMLWISFATVSTTAAEYFEKEVSDINLLSTVSFVVGMPFCFVSTWLVDRKGLRPAVFVATLLTFTGGLIRMLGTFPPYNDSISKNTQFWLCVAAQAITGMGNPIALSLPTKVSQHWFLETELTLATGILAMSLPVGIVLGFGIPPLFVEYPDDIALMNWIYFIPAAVSLLVTVFGMRSSKPPTPPSLSATFDQKRIPYVKSMKKFMSTGPYLILFLVIGGAVGFFNAILTLLQQLACARGYSNEFSGLLGSLLLATGPVGAIVFGIVSEKTGRMIEVCKVAIGIVCVAGIAICELLRKPDMEVPLAILCAIFGMVAFGAYPLGLELSVEATYPLDEATGTVLIFFSVAFSAVMAQDLSNSELLIQECSSSGPDASEGQDHTNFLMLVMCYLFVLSSIFILFFDTKYNRSIANEQIKKHEMAKGVADFIHKIDDADMSIAAQHDIAGSEIPPHAEAGNEPSKTVLEEYLVYEGQDAIQPKGAKRAYAHNQEDALMEELKESIKKRRESYQEEEEEGYHPDHDYYADYSDEHQHTD